MLRSCHCARLLSKTLRVDNRPRRWRGYADTTSPQNPNQALRGSPTGKDPTANKTTSAATPFVLPGSASKTVSSDIPKPPGAVGPSGVTVPREVQSTGSHADITPKSIPKLPPSPNPNSRPNVASLAADESKSITETIRAAPPDPSEPIGIQAKIDPKKPVSTTITAQTPSPESPSPSSPPKPRRFRRYLIFLTLLTGTGYAGGTYYALENDTFHDYFTEYVPGGEDAVLYFEERKFRQRAPTGSRKFPPANPRNSGPHVTIPKKSGVTWKVSDESNSPADSPGAKKEVAKSEASPQQKGSGGPTASEPQKIEKPEAEKELELAKAQPNLGQAQSTIPSVEHKTVRKKIPEIVGKESSAPQKPRPAPQPESPPVKKEPELPMPTRFKPISPLDPIALPNSANPLVQDLVKSVNSIITIINADGSQSAYSPVIDQARAQITRVAKQIKQLQVGKSKKTKAEITKVNSDSKAAAQLLVDRFSDVERLQEAQWRDELAQAKADIAQEYETKVKEAITHERDSAAKHHENVMLEQALKLKHAFIKQVKSAVDHERDGRLANMEKLNASVKELEDLTGQWAIVVDQNLKTQHLNVAVEALRQLVDKARESPAPFVNELLAVKELGQPDQHDEDGLIDVAIGCVQPSSYHRGIPTTSMLITRFRAVAAEIRKAALLPEEAGVASHAVGRLLGSLLVSSTPGSVGNKGGLSDVGSNGQGIPVGEDVDSVLRRAEIDLEEGRLEDAAREINGLKGWAGRLGKDWVKDVRRVCEVRDVVEILGAEARLRSLKADAIDGEATS